MKNYLIILFIACVGFANAQTKKYFSLGSKHEGICFGNSEYYNGIRFSLFDFDKTKYVNGLNFSFGAVTEKMNGCQLGFAMSTTEVKLNGISIGMFLAGTKNANGILVAGGYCFANKVNGIAASLFFGCDTINGFSFSMLNLDNDSNSARVVNGCAISVSKQNVHKFCGILVSLTQTESKKHYGLSIAGFNKTEELHGLQIGLWNVALNNPKIFRRLPFINFHL